MTSGDTPLGSWLMKKCVVAIIKDANSAAFNSAASGQ
ncbi:MAG: hypothetical protein ACJAZO_000144 [Myxococcota bacterium]|jgi:hypothetical protein